MSIRARSAKQKKALSMETARRNREADTVYWVTFIPIGKQGAPKMTTIHPEDSDPWRIRLSSNPRANPSVIEQAIKSFERRNGVKAWTEIASQYIGQEHYFP
jgi:hypothetical protein